MSDEKVSRLQIRFTAAAKAHHDAIESMDEVRAVSHARLIEGLACSLRQLGDAGHGAVMALLACDEDAVAGMAAVCFIRSHTENSVAILRRLSEKHDLLGFRASVALERWEAGEWGP
ncbi:hypothetical protein SAMN06269301_1105 [Geobacter sp. DSM 9736]|nr:hypothetical protein SAMN06269301_1105 [Geobacter sp. DSM 9736]